MSVELVVTNLLTASEGERERVRSAALAVQIPAYRAVDGDAEAAAQRVTEHVDAMLDAARFAHFNIAVIGYADGAAVACCLAEAEIVDVDGQPTELVRFGVNVAAEARNQRLVAKMFMKVVAAYGSKMFTTRPRYYLGHCMTPVTYHLAFRRARHVYPGPRPTPPAMARVYEAVHGHAVGAVHDSVCSEVDPTTEAWIARTDSEAVRFYLEECPDFRRGMALPLVVRVDLASIVKSTWINIQSRLRNLRRANPARTL